jgi:hypothetical protein
LKALKPAGDGKWIIERKVLLTTLKVFFLLRTAHQRLRCDCLVNSNAFIGASKQCTMVQ